MSRVSVAVIIVTYRSAELAIQAMESVHRERMNSDLEIRLIVVDNCSGDYEEISRYVRTRAWQSWVQIIVAPKNGGFAYGNNLGIGAAFSGVMPDYIYLLNPDAQVRPNAIWIMVQFLEQNPQASIAGSSIETVDGAAWPYAFRFPGLASEIIDKLEFGLITRILKQWEVPVTMTAEAQPVDWISGASMMIRPIVFLTIGGMDENYFLYYEETDFCLRAKKAGFQTWYVPASRVMHVMGQSTGISGGKSLITRLPSYWFDSRRRYFTLAYGTPKAVAIDLVAMGAHILGNIKRFLLGRTREIRPYYFRDLLTHSVLWKVNRGIPDPKTSISAAQLTP